MFQKSLVAKKEPLGGLVDAFIAASVVTEKCQPIKARGMQLGCFVKINDEVTAKLGAFFQPHRRAGAIFRPRRWGNDLCRTTHRIFPFSGGLVWNPKK